MQKTRHASNTRARTLQIVCILLLLALLVGIVLNEALRSARIDTEAARTVTLMETDYLEGFVFRDETAISSRNNGVVAYQVANGQEVVADQLLAAVYTDETGGDQRQRAAALLAERERLQGALDNGTAWQPGYISSYASLMDTLAQGDLYAATADVATLTEVLCHRAAGAGAEETYRARIAAIDAEIADMVRNVDEPEKRRFEAAGLSYSAGAFFYETDGYEALLGKEAVIGLTPEGLDALLAAPRPTTSHIGKVVDCGAWYLAFPTTVEIAQAYCVGESYLLRMSACGTEAVMELCAVAPSEDGARALLTFRSGTRPAALNAARRQCVEIERTPVTGLSVPASAVRNENGERGVYVKENGIARWRRVELLSESGGAAIVAPCALDGMLREGEEIILTARRLYDGKTLR